MSKKDKNTSSVKVLGTANTFKYNVETDAIIDGNSVQQLIFVKEYKGERKTMMDYTWYGKDENGNVAKRGIRVSGHGEYGIPTLAEYSVYSALQRLFIQQKTVRGVCELKYEDYDDEYLTINFNITELAKEMGYASTPSKTTRDRLKKSIEILLATTLFSTHEGGLYDIREKKYIKTNLINGFHLLESINAVEDENEIYTRVKLSEYTYNQIVNDFKLFYNRNKFNTIKNNLAKKIYHLALQWKGDKNFSFANIDTLTERIPSIQEEKKYNKRDIKKSIEYLQDKNIVGIKYDEKNSDKVYFVFEGNDISDGLKDKYKTYKDIREKLFEMEFNLAEVDELLDVEKIRYIQALLRYMDTREVKRPKWYFKKCLSNPIKIPVHFYDESI
ncbi:hypothetical protein [Clostridium sp.]|uniref:hypothetical protein n=1 Tax=Clostridium sp. TaxID=1506 RepID=UPI00290B13A2|nr:hypothetical protein [Clostridium sp.]MDU3410075.1 hypothetical protein [Clostridium sp.]